MFDEYLKYFRNIVLNYNKFNYRQIFDKLPADRVNGAKHVDTCKRI